MAILEPFECTVFVDGVAVVEYNDDDEQQRPGENEITRYVEAISGANFALHFKIQQDWRMKCDFLTWEIHFDGKRCLGAVVLHDKYSKQTGFTDKRDGQHSGSGTSWSFRNFKFVDITIGQCHNLDQLRA